MDAIRRALRQLRGRRLAVFAALGAACALAVGVALGIALSGSPERRPAVAHVHLDDPSVPLGELEFIEGMIPHHQLAVEMAELALEVSDDPGVVDIARDVAVQQPFEIDLMRRWRSEWFGIDEDAPTPELTPEALEAMGMDVDLDELREADPFPPAFHTAMIPHHRAAVVMARRVLLSNPRPELRRLAVGIIRGQTDEIRRMRRYRAIALGEIPEPPRPPVPERPITP